MKNLLAFILIILSTSAFAELNFSDFGKLPVLHNGRVKPLDTYARVTLLLIHEKSTLKNASVKMSATQWMTEMLFDNDRAFKRNIFRIRNKDVTKALDIEHRASHLFSFYEVSLAMKAILPDLGKIYEIDPKERTPSQGQLIAIYFKVMKYFDIARSLSLLSRDFEAPSAAYAEKLNIKLGKKYSYLDLYKRKDFIYSESEKFSKAKKTSEDQKYMLLLSKRLIQIENDKSTTEFKIVPPQFSSKKESDWYSPWETLLRGKGSPLTVKYFSDFADLTHAYKSKNEKAWDRSVTAILNGSHKMSRGTLDKTLLDLEVIYNKVDFFTKAITFYILSFLFLSLSWIYKPKLFTKLSYGAMAIGFVPHLIGLILRCVIMSRPPVTTLYESIVSVALVASFGALVYERKHKNGIGSFVGSTLGIILIFISFGYEKQGDSMGMLAAVLNTNFWLATHVVTITIGYGCCYVGSMLGHIYLIQSYIQRRNPARKFDLKSLNKSMQGVTMYSLLFTVLGTILGGIWADQSWGRFWGWDPKENGALLICLWLLFIMHGRLAGYLKPKEYAAGLVFTGIVVAFAWFGVNLLGVGLHSYGFTSSILNNLVGFSVVELVFAGALLFLLRERRKKA